MKITKAQGMACLVGLGNRDLYNQDIEDALITIGWKDQHTPFDDGVLWSEEFRATDGHYLTALAMCAAIAGVKP